MRLLLIILASCVFWAQAPTAHAENVDFVAERTALTAALARASSDVDRRAAADALGRLYWRHGLLAETTAALQAVDGVANPELLSLALTARGLRDEHLAREAATVLLAPQGLSAFVHAGRLAELDAAPVPYALLAAARNGYGAAPHWARMRLTPALADAAARAGAPRLAAHFARLAEQVAGADAALFAQARAAHAARNMDRAKALYAQAAEAGRPERSAWTAQARFHLAALDWAQGDTTPSETTQILERLLTDWPSARLSARALPALARAYRFAGQPRDSAAALIAAITHHTYGPYADHARKAQQRLDALLDAVIVTRRYPEMSFAARIDFYAAARLHAAAPMGALAADHVHWQALLDADLPEEVLRLAETTPDAMGAWRTRARAALAHAALPRPQSPDSAVTAALAPPTPQLAPRPLPASAARRALLRVENALPPVRAVLDDAAWAGDLTGEAS